MKSIFLLVLWISAFAAQIQIGEEILTVEIADTPEARAKGLMGRTSLPEGSGMLFVYPKPERLTFWMKETLIPLSIAFFDEHRILIHILDMDPPAGKTLPRYRSAAPARFALEVPQGWFAKHRIGPGSEFSFLDPSNSVK